MNSVERVKAICKDRGIPISKLEKDLGFSNGYIRQLRRGVFPADRLTKIAQYFDVSPSYLMTGKTSLPDQEKVTYCKVTPDMVSRIVTEHIVNDRVVSEYTIGYYENNQK